MSYRQGELLRGVRFSSIAGMIASTVLACGLVLPASADNDAANTTTRPTFLSEKHFVRDFHVKYINPTHYSSNLVLYQSKDVSVPTRYGPVLCAANSVAYIYQNPNTLIVYAFDEKKKGDVRIVVGEKALTVLPGQQLLLTHLPSKPLEEIVPRLGIAYESPKVEPNVGKIRVFSANFMIDVAAEKIDGIRKLSESKDPEKREMLQRILKNAAVLQSAERRMYINCMRIPTVAMPKNETGSQSIASDFRAGFLQGKIDALECSKGRSISMISADPQKSDQDVHWVDATDREWISLKSTQPQTQHTAAVFTCTQDCLVKTDLAAVECKTGSTLFIDSRQSDVTICVLDSRRIHDVAVAFRSGQYRAVAPGCTLVLHNKSYEHTTPMPAPLIGYRAWWQASAGDLDVYGAQCSLSDAMYTIEPLRNMLQSAEAKEKATALSILKNFAILAHIDP
jgi:hypothetical protein